MFSPTRVANAFKYSIQGYKSAWQTESAFRDNTLAVLAAQIVCAFIQPAWPLWLLFIACNALLIICELFNTGIEYLADHISTEHHHLLGRAKDVGSATVLTALLLNALVLGTLIWQAVFA
ncbi:MAG: diacylglycerol kinase [Formosimonas sp.]|jgi:diacylglycerol kinase (ATP)